jgi:hypothetical protein
MKVPQIQIVSDHGSEVLLLGAIAVGLLGYMAFSDAHGQKVDVATCLVVLTSIIGAVEKRWTARTVDRLGASLANSPATEPPAPVPGAEPVP